MHHIDKQTDANGQMGNENDINRWQYSKMGSEQMNEQEQEQAEESSKRLRTISLIFPCQSCVKLFRVKVNFLFPFILL